MTTHEINLLIERYLDGATTPAEERELALAVQREDRPAEWAIIAEMLGELTLDEARYGRHPLQTPPQPLPEWRGADTNANKTPMIGEVTSPLHSGRGRGWVRWVSSAAAACACIAFVLSYNIIIKDAPRETAKVEPPRPIKTQQEPKPVLVAREEQPSHELQHQQVPTIQPLVRHNKPKPQIEQPIAEEQASAREPLPEMEPQLIAEAQEPAPPSEDLALCMALLAEVEARAIMLQQTAPTLDLAACNNQSPLHEQEEGRDSFFYEEFRKCGDLSLPSQGRVGDGSGGPMGLLLLNELLANIQQQSNRPELSL